MDEHRQEPDVRQDRERTVDRSRRATQTRDAEERQRLEWRDADQPDGWRHSDDPPLTDDERRETWPLG
jgi:hypothetical protein